MATHSSVLAWKIPWMEELGGLHGFCVRGHKESDAEQFLCNSIVPSLILSFLLYFTD